MPVYLAHGFRWPRAGFTGVRVHAIVNNLEDMSVEYIQNENTRSTILQNFRELYPAVMMQLEDPRTGRTLDFLEQYDPDDELSDSAVSQEYAWVVNQVITIAAGSGAVSTSVGQDGQSSADANLQIPHQGRPRTSSSPNRSITKTSALRSSTSSAPMPHHNPAALHLNVEDAMSSSPALTPQAWNALAELRDKIAEGERIGWWIIYNGDPGRAYEDEEDNTETESDYGDEAEDEGARTPTQMEPLTSGYLGQPLPTMLPPDLKGLTIGNADREQIGTAVPHPPPYPPPPPPPPVLQKPQVAPGSTTTRPKSSRSFTNPLKKKASKPNLQPPKNEEIPEPPKLNEINKKEGLRYKFFGRGSEKK